MQWRAVLLSDVLRGSGLAALRAAHLVKQGGGRGVSRVGGWHAVFLCEWVGGWGSLWECGVRSELLCMQVACCAERTQGR